jgi:thioredoxin 1
MKKAEQSRRDGGKPSERKLKMADVREITDATFDNDVIKAELPTLVDFWAPWCGPCRMVAPVVEELSQEYAGKVNFVKMNTDENPQVPGKFGIRSIPTLLIFKNGELKGTIVGFRPKSDMKKRLDEALA